MMATGGPGGSAGGPEVLSVRRFESGPPPSLALQVDAVGGDTYATTKEEEWVTKKKTELTTTRQIETRVQRQVVLEDGHVVEDSGPLVTTNTTEDTQKHEQKSTEHRTTGDAPPGPGWLAVAPADGVLEETTEKIVRTRDEQQDLTETEDVAHLGDISDQAYQTAVTSGVDLRSAFDADAFRADALCPAGPRLVTSSSKKRRVVDSADVATRRQATPDGRVVTETRRTTEHEEDADEELPDDQLTIGRCQGDDEQETRKEGSSKFVKTKDEDLVEYLADGVKVGEEMRYHAERTEGERRGACPEGVHQRDADTLSARMRHLRRKGALPAGAVGTGTPPAGPPTDRKDALTRRPLDFDHEEETRKHETSKWLTHHFGSESRSDTDDDADLPAAGTNTSFINVTMKSRPMPPPSSSSNDRHRFTRIASPVNGSSPLGIKTSALSSPLGKTSTLSSPVDAKSYRATVNSSTRVYVSSPESEEPSKRPGGDAFFQGVSDWERRRETRQTLDVHPERVTSPTTTKTSTPYRGVDVQSPTSRSFLSGNLVSSEARHQMADRSQSSPVYKHGRDVTHSPLDSSRSPFDSKSQQEFNKSQQEFNKSHLDMIRSHKELNKSHQDLNRSPVQDMNKSYQELSRSYLDLHKSQQDVYRSQQESPGRSHQQLNGSHLDSIRALNGSQLGYSRQELNQSSFLTGSRQHLERGVTSPGSGTPRGSSPAHARTNAGTNGWAEHEDDGYRGYRGRQDEPAPDYSPPSVTCTSPSGGDRDSPPNGTKKHFQRTRFAAEVPASSPGPRALQTTTSTPVSSGRSKSPGNIIGDSFRKLVGKLRTRSTERKRKNSAKKTSRSPSPTTTTTAANNTTTTYRPYVSVDSQVGGSDEEIAVAPVAPPRVSRQASVALAGKAAATRVGEGSHRSDSMERRTPGPGLQRYYLGEDPFGGSIYGREKEYDGVTPVKRRSQHRAANGHRRASREEDDMNRMNVHHVTSSSVQQSSTSSTLGRLSQSTGRLATQHDASSRHAQTLPRKLHAAPPVPPPAHAHIQVSIVNQVSPAKPARTYRSALGRSQSFSVQPLGDAAAPLKTPALLASLSRSQRDLTSPEPNNYRSSENSFRTSENSFRTNQDSFRTNQDSFSRIPEDSFKSAQDSEKKEAFMQGLLDRAPELFKTLHGDDASSVLPAGQIYTSTPVRHTVVETTHTTTTSKPLHNGYSGVNATSTLPLQRGFNGGALRNGVILDSTYSNGSTASSSPARVGPFAGNASPMRAGHNGNAAKASRVLESSHSFRSSSSTADSDPVRHLSSPYRQPIERGASPSLQFASSNARTSSPSLYAASRTASPFGNNSSSNALVNGTSRSVERRGSSDDYTETVRINSKSADPLRPSETNTVKSFSKKVVPSHAGHRATETLESHETTTITKSRLRPAGPGVGVDLGSAGYPTRNGGVVIQVRPDRM